MFLSMMKNGGPPSSSSHLFICQHVGEFFNSAFWNFLGYTKIRSSLPPERHIFCFYLWFVLSPVNEESSEFEGLWCLFNLCVGTAVGNEISTQWWPENNTKIYKNACFDYFYNKIEFSKPPYLVPLGLRNLQNSKITTSALSSTKKSVQNFFNFARLNHLE